MLFHNPKGAPSDLHCETLNGRAVSFQCIVKLAESAQEIVCLETLLKSQSIYFEAI